MELAKGDALRALMTPTNVQLVAVPRPSPSPTHSGLLVVVLAATAMLSLGTVVELVGLAAAALVIGWIAVIAGPGGAPAARAERGPCGCVWLSVPR